MSSSEPFCKTELLDEFDNDLELLSRLLDIFRADCETRLSKLNEACLNSDFAELRNEAHAIKSGVGNFFANRASQVASELETIGAEGRPEGAKETLKRLENEIQELIVAIEAVCAGN